MFSFFKKTRPESVENFLFTDMHSHLLPGIDDGADSIEESLLLIEKFAELGYKKIITTPHVMGDSYKNTPDGIREKLKQVKAALTFDMEIEAAAEYYIDDSLYQKIQGGEELLSFGKEKYVLIETSYLNEASYLNHITFELFSKGYTPVLAHPERYTYLYNNFKRYSEFFERGLKFQINLNSLTGYYSPMAKKIAEKLIDLKMVHFAGTDCHSVKHIGVLHQVKEQKYYHKLRDLPLLNHTL